MGKIRNLIAKAWGDIRPNLLYDIIKFLLAGLAIWAIPKITHVLDWVTKVETVSAIIVYVVLFVGLWNILSFVLNPIIKRIRSNKKQENNQLQKPEEFPRPQELDVKASPRPIVKKFSYYLDKITKGRNISSLGRLFLEKIKNSPPFLGTQSSIIPPDIEQKFTEHFLAKEAKKHIRGREGYQMSREDTHESIAKYVYGDEKYADIVKAVSYNIINGTFITLPYIDVTNSLGLSSKEIKKKVLFSQDSWIEPTVDKLVDRFSLVKSEAPRLMGMIYEAAQKTLEEENKEDFNSNVVNLRVEKHSFHPANPKAIGVIITTPKTHELTDMRLKLIELKKSPITIRPEDYDDEFDLKGDFRIRADDKRIIRLGELRGGEFFLLTKEPFSPERLLQEQQPGISVNNSEWELTFEIRGKMEIDFRKLFNVRFAIVGKIVDIVKIKEVDYDKQEE